MKEYMTILFGAIHDLLDGKPVSSRMPILPPART